MENPYSTKKQWSASEISYLKSEYPDAETIKIAEYQDRNYDSVRIKAQSLGLRKTSFAKRKINKRCGKKTQCNPVAKGEG